MGMVAAKRVFKIIDTTSQIDDTGIIEASNILKVLLPLKMFTFSYVENEEVLKGISFRCKGRRNCSYCRLYWSRKIYNYKFIKSFLRNK